MKRKINLQNCVTVVLCFIAVLCTVLSFTDISVKAEQNDNTETNNTLVSTDLSMNDIIVDLSDEIEYEAIVSDIYVANDGNSDKIYVVDTNKHVLIFSFNPQLLLLQSNDHIIVYIENCYSDSDVISIKYYKQFGFIPKV